MYTFKVKNTFDDIILQVELNSTSRIKPYNFETSRKKIKGQFDLKINLM